MKRSTVGKKEESEEQLVQTPCDYSVSEWIIVLKRGKSIIKETIVICKSLKYVSEGGCLRVSESRYRTYKAVVGMPLLSHGH